MRRREAVGMNCGDASLPRIWGEAEETTSLHRPGGWSFEVVCRMIRQWEHFTTGHFDNESWMTY